MDLMQELSESKIVAIIRGLQRSDSEPAVQALAEGGIRFVEVTLNTDGALETIERSRKKYDDTLRIGAGTVLDLEMAQQAVAAGAQYLISPNLDEQVVEYGVKQGVEVWPGVMTPTEMVRAFKAGAKAVKIFPAASLGVRYLKELKGPLGHIPMVATGGIGLQNIREFLDAGVHAVGVGGNLVNLQLIKEQRFEELKNLARQFASAVK